MWLIVDTWLSILEEALPRGGWALLDILDWASSGTALLLLMMYVLCRRRIGRAGVSVLYLRRIDHACQVSVLYHACQVSVLYLRRIDHACQEAHTSDTHYHIHIQEMQQLHRSCVSRGRYIRYTLSHTHTRDAAVTSIMHAKRRAFVSDVTAVSVVCVCGISLYRMYLYLVYPHILSVVCVCGISLYRMYLYLVYPHVSASLLYLMYLYLVYPHRSHRPRGWLKIHDIICLRYITIMIRTCLIYPDRSHRPRGWLPRGTAFDACIGFSLRTR